MSVPVYDVGDAVVLSVQFSDPDTSEYVDPAEVSCSILSPDGTESSLTYGRDAEVVKDAVGQYHITLQLDSPGNWYARWVSRGSWACAEEIHFFVQPTRFDSQES